MHYLDNLLMMGPADSLIFQQNLELMNQTCEHLGVPLKLEKMEGPASVMVFLGIEIDTVRGTLSLLEMKLQQYKAKLVAWSGRKVDRKKELLSQIRKLSHACRVVLPGRI